VQLFTSWLGGMPRATRISRTSYEARFVRTLFPAFRSGSRAVRCAPDRRSHTVSRFRNIGLQRTPRRGLSRDRDRESAASQYANNVSDGDVLDDVFSATVMSSRLAGAARFSLPLTIVPPHRDGHVRVRPYRLMTSPMA